jgi:hypothetical protein
MPTVTTQLHKKDTVYIEEKTKTTKLHEKQTRKAGRDKCKSEH